MRSVTNFNELIYREIKQGWAKIMFDHCLRILKMCIHSFSESEKGKPRLLYQRKKQLFYFFERINSLVHIKQRTGSTAVFWVA